MNLVLWDCLVLASQHFMTRLGTIETEEELVLVGGSIRNRESGTHLINLWRLLRGNIAPVSGFGNPGRSDPFAGKKSKVDHWRTEVVAREAADDSLRSTLRTPSINLCKISWRLLTTGTSGKPIRLENAFCVFHQFAHVKRTNGLFECGRLDLVSKRQDSREKIFQDYLILTQTCWSRLEIRILDTQKLSTPDPMTTLKHMVFRDSGTSWESNHLSGQLLNFCRPTVLIERLCWLWEVQIPWQKPQRWLQRNTRPSVVLGLGLEATLPLVSLGFSHGKHLV